MCYYFPHWYLLVNVTETEEYSQVSGASIFLQGMASTRRKAATEHGIIATGYWTVTDTQKNGRNIWLKKVTPFVMYECICHIVYLTL